MGLLGDPDMRTGEDWNMDSRKMLIRLQEGLQPRGEGIPVDFSRVEHGVAPLEILGEGVDKGLSRG